MDGRTYNPDDCVTVAQLRSAGVPVPAELPDAAWVPQDALRMAVQQRSTYAVDDAGQPDGSISVGQARAVGHPLQGAAQLVGRFVVPFRWDIRSEPTTERP